MATKVWLPNWIPTMNHALTLRVRYGFGEKFEDINNWTPNQKLVDCSGFARWAIWHASDKKVRFPDGSVNQNDHCKKLILQRVHYDAAILDRAGVKYLAFMRPQWGKAGHVWFVRNGVTWESFGGRGIGNRKANYPILRWRCCDCYILS